MQDMTPNERASCRRPPSYWQSKLAEGLETAFGPGADPSSGWGLGLLEGGDEVELHAFVRSQLALAATRNGSRGPTGSPDRPPEAWNGD